MVRRTNEKRRCIKASATTALVCKKARPEAAAATPVTVELWKTAPITGARARLISEKADPAENRRDGRGGGRLLESVPPIDER